LTHGIRAPWVRAGPARSLLAFAPAGAVFVEVYMRRVSIEFQKGEKLPFVAIDLDRNDVIFRHDNVEELETLCRKLRWDVVMRTAGFVSSDSA
jgi:hypothetical protein